MTKAQLKATLRIDKREQGRTGTCTWTLMHVPTEAKVLDFSTRKIAARVQNQLLQTFGEILLDPDPASVASRMREHSLECLRWMHNTHRYNTLQDMLDQERVEEEREQVLAAEQARWENTVFYFNEHAPRYGAQGKITSVEKCNFSQTPETLKCCIAWSKVQSSLGTTVVVEQITKGAAPANLPWVQVRPGREWRARINNTVFVIGAVGEAGSPVASRKFGLWTDRYNKNSVHLSECACEFSYRSLEEAQAAAEQLAS